MHLEFQTVEGTIITMAIPFHHHLLELITITETFVEMDAVEVEDEVEDIITIEEEAGAVAVAVVVMEEEEEDEEDQ